MMAPIKERNDRVKILHTADWHLGKIVNEFSMLSVQEQYLNMLEDYLKENPVDALIIAGDLYDRALPPKEAVQLANEFFTTVTQELEVPIFVISGNHDSNERIEYGADLFAHSGLYITGKTQEKVRKVTLGDANFYLVPYSDPREVAQILEKDEIKTPEDAIRAQINQMKEDWDESDLNIILYHGFVIAVGEKLPEESDSERPLSIGTIEYVPAEVFKDFDYVALGHLHKAQKVGSEKVRYSGSPIKYSKSEAHHKKQNLLVDVSKDGVEVEPVILPVHPDLSIVRGTFAELMDASYADYLFIELEDENYVSDAMNRLRRNYPNAMALEYVNQKEHEELITEKAKEKLEKMSLPDLFSEFYQSHIGHNLQEEQEHIVHNILEEIAEEENE